MSSLIPVTTVKLVTHLPLLDLLPERDHLSWVRGGEGLVGWGVYAKTTVRGPRRFRDAREWWQSQLATLSVTNTLSISGTGPLLFSSFSFDENEESVLIFPEIVVGTRAGISWMTWVGDKAQPYLPKKVPDLVQPEFTWRDGTLTPNEWMSRVATAIGEIEIGELEKVVLARDLIAVRVH